MMLFLIDLMTVTKSSFLTCSAIKPKDGGK